MRGPKGEARSCNWGSCTPSLWLPVCLQTVGSLIGGLALLAYGFPYASAASGFSGSCTHSPMVSPMHVQPVAFKYPRLSRK